MAKSGTSIYMLDSKVRILGEILHEAGQIKSTSIVDLAAYCDINHDTLRSACKAGKVSTTVGEKLCRAGKFSHDNAYWVDLEITDRIRLKSPPLNDYEGEDTPNSFRKHLRLTWGLTKQKDLRSKPSRPLNNDEALITFSFSDTGQSVSQEGAMDIFLELDGVAKHHFGKYKYGFNKLQISLSASDSKEIHFTNRSGRGDPLSVGIAKLSARGTEFKPRWVLSVEGGIIEGNFITSEEPLCRLVNQELDDSLEGLVSAQLYDGALVRNDGVKLPNAAKSAIIARLIAKSINDDVSETGVLVVGRQSLKIVQDLK